MMKNLKILVLAAALILFITSCKNNTAEKLPREAYSQNPEGIVMKSSPDVMSPMVAVIPFAEKVTLTENSDKAKADSAGNKSKWYKTKWNGKSGWIQESSVGAAESVIEQIKISIKEQKSTLTADFVKAFEASSVQLKDTYSYSGGEMDPAKVFFLSGGIMVFNSKIFTKNYSNTFFQYEFLSEGKLLKIKFADSKLNFTEYADTENNTQSVFKIDKNEETITYQVKDKGFFFLNWGFHRD